VKYGLRPKKQLTICKVKIIETDCFIYEIRAEADETVDDV